MKSILTILALCLFSVVSLAHQTNDPAPYEASLRGMISDYANFAPGNHVLRFVKAQYDASVQGGGTTASKNLGVWLPKNAFIVKSFYEVLTQETSSGVAPLTRVSCIGTGDILASTNIKGSAAGFYDGVSTGAASLFSSKASADCQIKVDIISALGSGISTGKQQYYIWYMVSGNGNFN